MKILPCLQQVPERIRPDIVERQFCLEGNRLLGLKTNRPIDYSGIFPAGSLLPAGIINVM